MTDVLFEGKGKLVSISGASAEPGGKINEIEIVLRWTDNDHWVNWAWGKDRTRMQRMLEHGCDQYFRLLVSDPDDVDSKKDKP
jgi:hypothetical protein